MQSHAFEDESFLYKLELQVKQLFSLDPLQVKLYIIKMINKVYQFLLQGEQN